MTKTSSSREAAGTHSLDSEASAEIRLSDETIVANEISERVRSAWPVPFVELGPFVERVVSRLDSSVPSEQALRQLVVEDLFLAYACSLGNGVALQAFAKECDGELRAIAGKLRVPPGDFDDIRQNIWNKLFLVSGDRPPKITEYSGKGKLRSWFRVLAARSILNQRRDSKPAETALDFPTDSGLWESAQNMDPELANVGERYRAAFRVSFESAARDLRPEERNLLRCHYILGMSTDQLAKTLGTHKATAARHVANARERLVQLTRSRLKRELGIDSGELDSVMRHFDIEMSISLSQLFK